jgi:hypothetical protein
MLPSRLATTLSATVLLAALASSAPAQGTTPVDLGKRVARSKYQLGRVFAVQELPDGRVVASDTKEAAFRLIDLATGGDALLGKQGDGPDEYRTATAVLPLPGDSLLLYDALGHKALHLTPSGDVAAVIPVAVPSGSRFFTLSATDGSGNLYYTVTEFDTAAKAMKPSASLRRLVQGGTTDQELMRINIRRADQAHAQGILVFPFRDAWAVRNDGLIARVLADSYQVIWSRDGHETGRTGPLPFQPIAISAAEQQAITDSMRQGMKNMVSSVGMAAPANRTIGDGGGGQTIMFGDGGGGGGTQVFVMRGGDGGGAPPAGADRAAVEAGRAAGQAAGASGQSFTFNPSDIPIAPFPATKPAIASSGLVAAFDPNGSLWVARERMRGDNAPKYDVIAEGKGIVGHVKLPANTRLVGFGKNGVYLARLDGEAEWLERYPLPKM